MLVRRGQSGLSNVRQADRAASGLLSTEVALADGRYTQKAQAGGRDREMWTAITLRRESGAWKIAAIRNMLPAAN
jgi:hypothetical protein